MFGNWIIAQMFIQIRGASKRCTQARDVCHFIFIKVCNKFVSIPQDWLRVVLKLSFCHLQASEKPGAKRRLIAHNSFPVMLAVSISEDFAPLQHGNFKKVAVRIDPELTLATKFTLLPTSAVERNIAKAMAA